MILLKDWKIKPRQWGPIRDVQLAVYRNAERLGIDPSKLRLFDACWQGAGGGQDILGSPLVAGAGTWGNNGRLFTRGDSNYSTFVNPFPKDPTVLSVIARYKQTFPQLVDDESMLCSRHPIVNTGWNFSTDNASGGSPDITGGLRFTIFGVADYTSPDTTIVENRLQNKCIVFDESSVKFYIDSLSLGSSNTGGMTQGDEYLHINKLRFADSPTANDKCEGLLEFIITSEEAWNASIVNLFAEQPYALLQPTSQLVIVDLGKNTGLEKGFSLI